MPDEIAESTKDFIEALRALDTMAEANIARAEEIRNRIEELVGRIEGGDDVATAVENEDPPLIVQLVTENIESLQRFGSELRASEARALRAHGYTMERIAEVFGVTRQRVSALLKANPGG